MDDRPLHPNLARLAAQYDEILRQFSVRQLDPATARNKIRALHARDDEGVVWSIDADTGAWMRRTRTGDWVEGTPPTSGLATPTAHDFSRDPSLFNPDSRIVFCETSDVPNGLAGSTRVTEAREAPRDARTLRTRIAVVLGVVVLAGVGLTVCGDGPADEAPTVTEAPVTGRPPMPLPAGAPTP